MGRETKFGLLVGLMFIILFGVILSGRAGSLPPEHAALPMGESQGHRTMAQTLNRTVDPFVTENATETAAPPAPVVAEAPQPVDVSMPAPAHLAAGDLPGPERVEERGTVAFGPVMVETPRGAEQLDTRVAALELPGSRPPAAAAAAPPEPNRPVYVIRSGDTLTAVARQFYGKGGEKYWQRIYEANKTVLRDPHRLAAGVKIVIPAPPAPAAPPAEMPRPEAPRTDTPRGDPMREVSDSAFAENRTAPPAARSTDVARAPAAETPRTGGRTRDAGAGIRDVTVQDLGHMYGAQSDFVEQPARVPATYTVRSGDTFYSVAARLYGDSKYGRLLYLKNQHMVSDASKLKPGQRIVLLDGASAVAPESAVAAR